MKTLYIERSTGECRNGEWVEKLDLEGVGRIVVGTGPGSFAGIRSALAFAQGYALGAKCEVLGLPSACACAAQAFAGEGMRDEGRAKKENITTSQPHNLSTSQSKQSNNSNSQTTSPSSLVPHLSSFRLAVVGDARQGKAWVALFDGYRLERDVFQTSQAELATAVPADCAVTTPDAKRIDGLLRDLFGDRYLGGMTPTGDGLRAFAEACPSILKPEPLPIYLNPAVR